MKVYRLSAYTIEDKKTKKPLDFKKYSQFKYGHRPTAIEFAQNIVETFLSRFSLQYLIANIDDVILSTAPYWCTPPSAHVLATEVQSQINEMLIKRGHGPLKFLKIHRSKAPSCDFSKLGLQERKNTLQEDTLSVDRAVFKNKILILVEDARITGAHEQKTIDFMRKIGVSDLIFLYAINVKGGSHDPEIESRMNHQVINNLKVLSELMDNPTDYILNARACRFILGWPNIKELRDFYQRLNTNILLQIHVASLNDGYGIIEKYRIGFEALCQEVAIRKSHEPILKRLLARLNIYQKNKKFSGVPKLETT